MPLPSGLKQLLALKNKTVLLLRYKTKNNMFNIFKINVNNGINQPISPSINFFNFSYKKDKEIIESKLEPSDEIICLKPKWSDLKTTLCSQDIGMINKINSDINVYLFIQKQPENSAWNLVMPVVHERETNRIYQYTLGYFALQGSGGGLNSTKFLIETSKTLTNKSIKVGIIPKVLDNELINGFQYADSGITLNHLIEQSTDLMNYRKGVFEWIYRTLNDILEKNN
jgi:hypothetical protein